jgi:hypothetical protein
MNKGLLAGELHAVWTLVHTEVGKASNNPDMICLLTLTPNITRRRSQAISNTCIVNSFAIITKKFKKTTKAVNLSALKTPHEFSAITQHVSPLPDRTQALPGHETHYNTCTQYNPLGHPGQSLPSRECGVAQTRVPRAAFEFVPSFWFLGFFGKSLCKNTLSSTVKFRQDQQSASVECFWHWQHGEGSICTSWFPPIYA